MQLDSTINTNTVINMSNMIPPQQHTLTDQNIDNRVDKASMTHLQDSQTKSIHDNDRCRFPNIMITITVCYVTGLIGGISVTLQNTPLLITSVCVPVFMVLGQAIYIYKTSSIRE